MITLKELAARCNVSIATVSNILNGKSNVGEETRQRILQVIKETGYRPNIMARGLRATKTKTIGLIVEDLTAFSSPWIIEGIMSILEEKDYRVVLENLRLYTKHVDCWDNKEKFSHIINTAINQMISIKVDGIIYMAGHSRNIYIETNKFDIPFVMTYAFPENKDIQSVNIDDLTSAMQMTETLIKNGKKKIAIIAGKEDNLHTQFRLQGCKETLEKHNIAFNNDLVVYADWERDGGVEATKKLLEKSNDIEAIFCFNDLMAAGCYDVLLEKNITPGKDISIVGFDNRMVSEYLKPSLTTMEIPLEQIGAETAKMLLEGNLQNKLIPCKLILRDSI